MKALNIKELLVDTAFYNGEVERDYTITYEDYTRQIFKIEDLTESDKHRIAEFMKKSQIDVTIRRYPKRNMIETIGRYYI